MDRMRSFSALVVGAILLVILTGCPGLIDDPGVVDPDESIQAAIDRAEPGDTIRVEGTHDEDIVIEKDGITLIGSSVANGDATELSLRSAQLAILEGEATVNANNVSINTFEVQSIMTDPGSFANLTLQDVTVDEWNDVTLSGTFTCTRIVQPSGSIQIAINNSGSGDNVCVAADTYMEQLTINDDDNGLTLRSFAGAGSTIIEADLANAGGSPKLIIVDDAKDVTINGFTLRDSKPNTTAKGTVHAVRVLATSGGDDASGFKLTNSIIEDLNAQDRVRAVAVNVIDGGSDGPSAGNADNPTIKDNVFRNLVVDGDALANDDSEESGNRVVGVRLNGSFSGAEVSNNDFKDFSISPRSGDPTNKCIIHAVELSEDNIGDGPTDFSITSNTFDNFDSCENTVNNEDVSSIAIFVGSLNSLGVHDISRNNFNFDLGSAPTLGAGVDTLASEEVDATNNWWGASDGPSTRSGIIPGRMDSVSGANGSGVLVSKDVDFSNFATSPF